MSHFRSGWAVWSWLVCWSASLQAQPLQRFEYNRPAMGTQFRLVLYAENEPTAATAAEAAFNKVATLNVALSDYLPESELSQLSATAGKGQWVSVSDDLWKIIVRSKQIAKASGSAFDPSIGSLSKLWRQAFRDKAFPPAKLVAEAKATVNFRAIHLRKRDQAVQLDIAGIQLDLGGIAKGYTADVLLELLEQQGIRHALVDAGGDLSLGAPPPDRPAWQVACRQRNDQGQVVDQLLPLSERGIATSGDQYRFMEHKGKRYSHIIDPRSGYGITSRRQVTVIAPDGMTADALASALSIVHYRKAKKILRKFKAGARILQGDPGQEQQWEFHFPAAAGRN